MTFAGPGSVEVSIGYPSPSVQENPKQNSRKATRINIRCNTNDGRDSRDERNAQMIGISFRAAKVGCCDWGIGRDRDTVVIRLVVRGGCGGCAIFEGEYR